MGNRKRGIITVFGSGTAPARSEAFQTAFAVGRMVAECGFALCNGGYGGTMSAGAQGAVKAGGHTIGVTCAALGRPGPNPWVRQEVPTFDLFARLTALIRLGDAFIVLPGGTGTLLELAAVWELLGKGLLRPQRPVLLLANRWQPVLECVRRQEPAQAQPRIVADLAALREALEALQRSRESVPPRRAAARGGGRGRDRAKSAR